MPRTLGCFFGFFVVLAGFPPYRLPYVPGISGFPVPSEVSPSGCGCASGCGLPRQTLVFSSAELASMCLRVFQGQGRVLRQGRFWPLAGSWCEGLRGQGPRPRGVGVGPRARVIGS